MNRRDFIRTSAASLVAPLAVGIAGANNTPIPESPKIETDKNAENVLDDFEKVDLGGTPDNDWSSSGVRYVHRETRDEFRENLGLKVPPYGVYLYHLNRGERVDAQRAIKQEECVLDVPTNRWFLKDRCFWETDRFVPDPEPTEIATVSQDRFDDQLEQDFSVSANPDWEYGLVDEGWGESGWPYTKSEATVYDKQTSTATIEANESNGMDDDLEIRCFLTTENTDRLGHWLAVIGIVPDTDEITVADSGGFLGYNPDAIDLNKQDARDDVRTLMKNATV